jgi:chromate reductase
MRILAISGSLRRDSLNTRLLRAAAQRAPEHVEVEFYEELESLPPYNEDRDLDGGPEAVAELRRLIRDADAVLFATPEYNGTVPGQLKQVVDWGSRPRGTSAALHGKPVAVIGASQSDYGAMWAQEHLRRSLGIAGARVVDLDVPVGRAQDKFDAEGNLTDPDVVERLDEVFAGLLSIHDRLAAAA